MQIALLSTIVIGGMLLGPLNVVTNSALASNVWSIAGQTFRYASSIAGLIVCIESAGFFQKDRLSGRFELLIPSEYHATHYAVSRFIALLLPIIIAGVLLATLSQAYCYINFSLVDPGAFLAAFGMIYLPLAFFSIAFGVFFSLVTNSQSVTLVFYLLIWIIGFLPLPPATNLLDLSGESLYVAFFDLPIDSLSYDLYKDQIPLFVWEEALRLLVEQKAFGQASLVVLVALSALFSIGTVALLAKKWTGNAESLLAFSRTAPFANHFESRPFAFFKTSRLWQLVSVGFFVSFGFLLAPFSDNPHSIGLFCIEPLTAICVAAVLFNSLTYERTIGIQEMSQISPLSRFYFGLKIFIILIATTLFVSAEAYLWQNVLGVSVAKIIIGGLTASMFFMSVALLLSSYIQNRITSMALLAALWLFLQIPTITSIGLSCLHPFQFSTIGDITIAPFAVLVLFTFSLVLYLRKSNRAENL